MEVATVTIAGRTPILLSEELGDMHRNEAEEICFPAEAVKDSIVTSANRFTDPDADVGTLAARVEKCVQVMPPLISFKVKNHELFKRAAQVNNRRHNICPRPMIQDWELTFELSSDDLPMTTVREILDRAGEFTGIGNYIPDFGRFKVTSFET